MKSFNDRQAGNNSKSGSSSATGVISYIRSYLSNKINNSNNSSSSNSKGSTRPGHFSLGATGCSSLNCEREKNTSSMASADRHHKKVTQSTASSSSCKASFNAPSAHIHDRKSYLKSQCQQEQQNVKTSTSYRSLGPGKVTENNLTSNNRSSHKFCRSTDHFSSCNSSFAISSKSTNSSCDSNSLSSRLNCPSTANSISNSSSHSLTSGYSSSSSKMSSVPFFDPRSEITRKYIVPPPNRSIGDVATSGFR